MSMAKSKQQFNRLINWSGLYSASNGKGEVTFLIGSSRAALKNSIAACAPSFTVHQQTVREIKECQRFYFVHRMMPGMSLTRKFIFKMVNTSVLTYTTIKLLIKMHPVCSTLIF